jgi:hypothetical protein
VQTRRFSLTSLQRWRRPPRWGWAVGLVFCLLLGQGLGAWHRIQHQPVLSAGAAQAVALADAESASTASDFWSHAAGRADCQLWDHLLLGDQHAPPAVTELRATPPEWAFVAIGAPRRTVPMAWLPPVRGPPIQAG